MIRILRGYSLGQVMDAGDKREPRGALRKRHKKTMEDEMFRSPINYDILKLDPDWLLGNSRVNKDGHVCITDTEANLRAHGIEPKKSAVRLKDGRVYLTYRDRRLRELYDQAYGNGSEQNEVKQDQAQLDEVKQNQVEKKLTPQTDGARAVIYAVCDPMYKFILEFDQLLTRLHFDESSRPELDNCIGLVLDRMFREKTN